ncbi:hypothetical protein CP966_25160 [Streptomyces galilaeus]|jgi:hypothetical protein|uniref:Uncharacterized protein n=2 Tax=Streptomyces TaxID=1883 RepID=A0ABW9IG04_STRGJ|nr:MULTISPECIES: hypothetical protein [Streptomyces]QEU68169.1 hypothetical protein CP966_25160 [Streptomyces galilaeus]GGW47503.1 hypothetical protein GCM10010350_34550 [Streptomyces galilaeus]
MIAFAFEPRAEDVLWSPDRRPENLDRPEHPEPTGADFSLSYFRADVRLVVHGVDLSLCTPGLPVVDFALMLEYARRELETRSDIAVETSVTQHVFSLSRGTEAVTLTTNYAPGVAELTWPELWQLTDRAKAEAFRLITTAHPELRDNAWLRGTVGASPAA